MSIVQREPIDSDELDVAPLDWADFTVEERAEIQAAAEDIRSGRVAAVPHAAVQQALQVSRRAAG